ncbi:hypothetical protein NLM33_41710 [Bradyrhizobium sp. CCGUVB1N3]|uniref:hypothetical protein n=1 Tax=Bradyrhizobium sp. CCGUVB1N3 TaxID=2949629 RepID=UPI0020B2532B|nr:hypothetical protein [Bradyrhizobium sp. CCGUVB1N3]MCP3476683.1 hypothetical protein [Bradyrhizobium sp. CCGUVB1N3]
MSKGDSETERTRPSFSFTDLYFFGRLIGFWFGFGLTVVMCAEMYLAFSGAQRPAWLDPLESFYGAVWKLTKHVTAAAFNATGDQVVASNPHCVVDLVRFKTDGVEDARTAVLFKSLIVLPDIVKTNSGTSWQKARTQGDAAHATQGWVIKTDLDEKSGRAECR